MLANEAADPMKPANWTGPMKDQFLKRLGAALQSAMPQALHSLLDRIYSQALVSTFNGNERTLGGKALEDATRGLVPCCVGAYILNDNHLVLDFESPEYMGCQVYATVNGAFGKHEGWLCARAVSSAKHDCDKAHPVFTNQENQDAYLASLPKPIPAPSQN